LVYEIAILVAMTEAIHFHFKKHDPLIYTYIKRIPLASLEKDKPSAYFSHLCREIIRQQLSGKAADAIEKRFLALLPHHKYTPEHVLTISHDEIRNAGLSHAKANYVHDLAKHVKDGSLHLERFTKYSDEEIIKELTMVKGIGQWTAEMFLMFAMGREDVFSFGDLGLKKGIVKVYGFKNIPAQKTIEKIIRKWSPYKTYASRILWASLDME